MSDVFRGGVPYAVDVNRIKERWPVPELSEGTVIPHDEIAAVIGVSKRSARYYGVVNSWLREMWSKNGIVMYWFPSKGVKVLPPHEVLDRSETIFHQKIRQTGRAIKNFGKVDRSRLDETGKARLDHDARVAGALKGALESARKDLPVELAPVQSLPKPKLLRQA